MISDQNPDKGTTVLARLCSHFSRDFCVSNLYFDQKSKLLKTKRHAGHVTFVDTARFKVLFSILYLDPSMS